MAGMDQQQPQRNNPALAILHHADALAQAFNRSHAASTQLATTVQNLGTQQRNLQQLSLRSASAGAMSTSDHRERTLARLQASMEEALSGVRDELFKMESIVGEMQNMLYEVEIYLSNPTTQLQVGFNPQASLAHVSDLFHMYQAELLSKRELLADFTSEEIGVEEFVARWRVMSEVDKGEEEAVGDLSDMLSKWGQHESNG